MKKHLRISDALSLPVEAVAETFAVLAQRGAGKTNTARVMAEEFFAAGAPFVAVDPVGSWWGLRAGRDGKPGGIPIPVLGGKHGDVPLERSGGNLVADLIVDQRLSCVLDLSGFDSEAAKKQFLLDFARRLYQRNTEPLHLFLEECDDYVPQRPGRDELQLLRAWENIVRRGRARGLGITLITQRSAVVNKNVLTQVGTLIAMRCTSPQDRAAVAAWVEYHGEKKEILESLSGLANGEAWVWSPQFLKKTERVLFRQSTTFDSGATPKLGAKPAKAAATLADVDLAALQKRMAATIERAKAEDPKALQAEVAKLRRELAAKPAPAAPKVERVEVPVLLPAQVTRLEAAFAATMKAVEKLDAVAASIRDSIRPAFSNAIVSAARAATNGNHTRPPAPVRETNHRFRETKSPEGETKLGRCERALLSVLAQHGACSMARLSRLAGYSATSSGFTNALGALRSAGLISPARVDPIEATDDGRATIGGGDPLPEGQALVEHWFGKLGKCERAIASALLFNPAGLSTEELAAASCYSETSSGFTNALGALRSLGLITAARVAPIRLCDELLAAGGAA